MSDATWTAVAAISAAISAIASLGTIVVQAQSARNTRSVDVWMRMESIFDSADLRRSRIKAANALRTSNDANADVDTVLDYFDSLGHLVRTKVISERLAWHSFYYWTTNLGVATAGYLAESRQDDGDPTVWEDFLWLVGRLNSIEMQRRGSLPSVLTPEDTAEFLQGEASLNQ